MGPVLVTGAAGFLGRHLCNTLRSEFPVVGVDREGVQPVDGIAWRAVSSGMSLGSVATEVRPRAVVHGAFLLKKPAGMTTAAYLETNLAPSIDLFEALAQLRTPLVLVSSSAVYGGASGTRAITESDPVDPASLYGLAKLLQEQAARYWAGKGLGLVVGRIFNLAGPGQKAGMLLPDWVRQAVAVARGSASQVSVFNRATSRDFVDVRDVSRALALMVRDFRPGEVFNIATGITVSLREVSEELSRISPVPLQFVETNPAPAGDDVSSQRGDSAKLTSTLGWRPQVDWRASLKDLWDEYRANEGG